MTEKVLAIQYLVAKLNGSSEIHCDIFRHIQGMKPATAERRLREWREYYHNNIPEWKACKDGICRAFVGNIEYKPGYTVIGHIWKFTRPFIAWLKQQVKAAYRLEAKRGSR